MERRARLAGRVLLMLNGTVHRLGSVHRSRERPRPALSIIILPFRTHRTTNTCIQTLSVHLHITRDSVCFALG